MARREEIEIFITDEGKIQFHIKGIKGGRCVDLAKLLGEAMGGVDELNLTSEYYQKEAVKEKAQQKVKKSP